MKIPNQSNLSPEELRSLEPHEIMIWLYNNQLKNEQGIRLDFHDHLYLYDIYRDFTPKQVCLKAAQICFSTTAILKTIYIAKHLGLDIIYTLPTAGDVLDFVGGKVNRLIANNHTLQEYVADRDTFEQKRVGKNVIYYRGTWTSKAALMVSSDLNVYDEEDRSKQDVIQQYASRLQHSPHKWEWHFSNPSVAGNGVARYWPHSDQKHWFIKCPACKKKQYLAWPESIDIKRKIYVCKYCGHELSREDRRRGEWVRKFRDKEYSGYWISLLMTPWTTASEIIDYYKTKSEEYFYNFVLGLPYVGEGNIITPDMVYRNLTEAVNDQENIVIGSDSGRVKHYVMGNKDGLFFYGKTEAWADIARLLTRFKTAILVVDALPDLTGPRILREQFPGRVFLVHYQRDRKTMQLIRWGQGDEVGNVVADRNRMIQLVIDEFTDKRIPLQGTEGDWQEYYSHWQTLFKTTEEDALGVPQMVWNSSDGKDHWCHATVYWRIGMDKHGWGATKFLGVPDGITNIESAPVVTPDGQLTGKHPKVLTRNADPALEGLAVDWRDI